MTELEIEELERKVTGSNSVIVEEARSVEALPGHVGEDVRNVLPEMGIERGRKDRSPALRYVPNKKLLEETAKVD